MKVIFLQDVTNVAKAGDTKEVADGFGRNYLLPKQLAVLANASARNVVERQKKIEAKKQAEQADIARKIDGTAVTLKARAGAEDKLFGSVTAGDIAAELLKVTGIEVDKRKIEMAEPIKQLGDFELDVKLAKDVPAKIKVTVIAMETDVAAAAEETKAAAAGEEAKQSEHGETTAA